MTVSCEVLVQTGWAWAFAYTVLVGCTPIAGSSLSRPAKDSSMDYPKGAFGNCSSCCAYEHARHLAT